MKKLLAPLLATAALAAPGSAIADGHGHGLHVRNALVAKLTGTGTSFGGAAATSSGTIALGRPLASGSFAASFSSDWTHAVTTTTDNGSTALCAPATATLTLTDSTSSANTTSSSLTGKTCSLTKNGTVSYVFFGAGTRIGAGEFAGVSGMERAFLTQSLTGAVQGTVLGTGEPVKVTVVSHPVIKKDAVHAVLKRDSVHHKGGRDRH